MLGALGRYIRALGYFLTGRIDAARKELTTNPYVIQATYDKIVAEKKARIGQYKDAVAAMIAQEEKKRAKVKSLSEEVQRLNQLKEGAAARAKQLVQQMQAKGLSPEQIKADPEYAKCLAAFNDFSSTLTEKNGHVEELEADIAGLSKNIGEHKVQLQSLLREIEKVKEEAAGTIADVITAKEEQQIADMISGISKDQAAKELQELRDIRQQVKAGARVSRELAGVDTKRQEAEFLEYARSTSSNKEFEALIGLASASEAPAQATPEARAKLPE